VTEVRVHGVGGTQPQYMLGDPAPQQVGGDSIAGFYRGSDAKGRHIEAYSWGGLTSRSGTRVLWLLLLPFLLANLAGWMLPPQLLSRPRTFAVYRAAMRVAALALTLNAVLFITWIPIDYIGYQCGARTVCTKAWALQPFLLVQDFPGRRILLAAVIPLLIIALLGFLSHRSVQRYESVRPPSEKRLEAGPERGAAALTVGLAHRDFWDGRSTASRLGLAHIAASAAMLAGLITHTVRATVNTTFEPLGPITLALSGFVLLGAVALLLVETRKPWPEILGRGLLATASVALLTSAIFAWSQPEKTYRQGELPGMQEAAALTYGVVFLSLLAVLVMVIVGSITSAGRRRWIISTMGGAIVIGSALWLVDIANFPGLRIGTALVLTVVLAVIGHTARRNFDGFRWAPPFIVMSLAVAVLNIFMIGLLIQIADAIGDIRYSKTRYIGPPEQPAITVIQVIRPVVPYLVFVPLAITLLFLGWQLILYLRAVHGRAWARVRAYYLWQERRTPSPYDPRWTASTVSDKAVRDRKTVDRLGVRPWARKVAGRQRLALAALDMDLLFTGLVAMGFFLVASLEIQIWQGQELVKGLRPWMVGIATTIAAGLPLLLVALLRTSWNDPDRRRVIGVLWDVGTFWPRSYHPLAPPSYAERAVPELQRRIWWLHDNGGRLLITAHSQGSVLAAAALAQPDHRDPKDLVSLVTFGSPLNKLYHWGFPAYFNNEVLGKLRVTEWTNLSYLTDYIGADVRADAVCRDVRLPDPPTSRFLYGEPLPPVGSHTGYSDDPALWEVTDRAATDLAAQTERAAPPEIPASARENSPVIG
jgi:hypothetical protein